MSQPIQRRLAATDVNLPPDTEQSPAKLAVLSEALRLFAERGFAGASMRDIASNLGMKPASIYSHYASKEEMLFDLLRIGHENHLATLQAAINGADKDPISQISAFMRGHVEMHSSYPMLATVVNTELHSLSAQLTPQIMAIRKQSEALLSGIISNGVTQGVFSVPHEWLASAVLGGMGIRVANWYSPELGLSPETIADSYVEYALRILGAK
ncbi:TetR/AcrR family transcriptional regulator [Spongiibacter sp. KMU-158]|uniref:TetR/AcrR family transcriptional regulator n=1 Tax=Spongiibacter pelagi TaxID=2760804 RepID=A0A927GVU2_9GAMM|nr:TetR family transcriptional regulator [Spongiibacter pelagi]MBD2857734.1 TetR/AcrR family transcriptional regulator [Spongiibacter pelagi]